MTEKTPHLPALSPGGNLDAYLTEIRRFPMLEAEQEYMLAKRWAESSDKDAAQQLVTSHLRLVAKVAMGYRGYGLPLADLISEGNVGLMQAVKKFDAEKGFRLATYAIWWIKASIHEYILRSWSLVKVGTTAAQKKLFFNLRRMKSEMQAIDDGALTPEQVKQIATKLDVREDEVSSMEQRMGGRDHSLNAPMRTGEADSGEWIDWLEDSATQIAESMVIEQDERSKRLDLLQDSMRALNEREQIILTARRLAEKPRTLEDLSQQFGVSRERIRQIENRAFEKLQKSMRMAAHEKKMISSELAEQ
ncbi:MAG: RNA polymerase sigma factor RpoH [Alphaproteobacteria bacterium]